MQTVETVETVADAPSRLVATALQESEGSKRRGRCTDRRFAWKVINDDGPDDRHHEPDDPGRDALYEAILEDGWIGGQVIGALFDAACRVRGCRVVLSGSTGTRELVAAARGGEYPFEAADVDVDVYAPHEDARGAVVNVVQRACAEVLNDAHFVRECVSRVPEHLRVDRTCNRNSALILRNRTGNIVRVEIPRFAARARRLPYSPVYATLNFTLENVALLRFRLHMADDEANRHFSLPLVDVKVRTSPLPELERRRVAYGGALVRVPSARAAIQELDRLLERDYDHVDERKDERRLIQKRALEDVLAGRSRPRGRRGDVRSPVQGAR